MNSLVGELSNLNINDKRHHRKKKNKKEKEKEKEEDPKEKKFKEELNELKAKIRDFQKLFDNNEVKNIFEYKIENFILIDKLVDELSVKQKLLECFNCKDIFDYLFDIWIKILEFSGCKNKSSTKDKTNENTNENINETEIDGDFEEKKEHKTKTKGLAFIFNQILASLDFFVPKIINNTKDNSFKAKVIETIFPNIQFIKNIEEGEYFLYYFTNVFNIKNEIKSLIEKEKKEEVNQIINNSLCFGLNLINIFDLQEMFPLEKIFKIISDNYFLISYRIYSLLARAYIKKDEQKKYLILDKLFEFIEENKNLIDFELVYNLVNNDFKDDKKRGDFIMKFVKGIKIYFDRIIRENNLNNAIYYCKLVFENPDLFTKKDKDNAANYICDKYFNNIKDKDWKNKILYQLDLFEYKDLKNHLSLENLETFYYQLPLNAIESFMRILKFMPRETYKLLRDISKEKNYDGGAKIIKKLDLPYDSVPLFFIDERIYKFFCYKITNCKDENNPYTLIEYCLISQRTLDISIQELLKRYNRKSKFANFYLYVINELYYRSYDKGLKLNKKITREIEDLFYGIKYVDNYTFKDHFGPIEKNCFQIDPNKTKVLFIDNANELEKALKTYFMDSKYIGIDSEWQQSFSIKEEIDVSIIQLSTEDEKCCVILDMLSLKNSQKFYEVFKNYFKGKIFVGFSFDRNDLMVFPPELKEFFEDPNSCTIYDLCIIYKQKYLKKCSSLKAVTEEILGQSLCKYEQCSDWNLRPISQTKLHYAALDALICIILYKKIVEDKSPIQSQNSNVKMCINTKLFQLCK